MLPRTNERALFCMEHTHTAARQPFQISLYIGGLAHCTLHFSLSPRLGEHTQWTGVLLRMKFAVLTKVPLTVRSALWGRELERGRSPSRASAGSRSVAEAPLPLG